MTPKQIIDTYLSQRGKEMAQARIAKYTLEERQAQGRKGGRPRTKHLDTTEPK